MPEYSVFLDESGVESYKDIGNQYVVGGLVILKDYFVDEVMKMIRDFKMRHFNNDKIVFHFFDMYRRKGDFRVLSDPEKAVNFWDEYTQLLHDIDFKVLAAIVNKSSMTRRYIYPQAARRVAFPVIYENLVHFLASNDGIGKIFAEEIGEDADNVVFVQYHLTMANGTSRVNRDAFLRYIKGLKFQQKKQNIIGLQLADTIAYILNKGDVAKNKYGPDFEKMKSIILDKTYDGGRDKKDRYGIKYIP